MSCASWLKSSTGAVKNLGDEEDDMQMLISKLIGHSIVPLGLALFALFVGSWRKPALAHAVWILVLAKLITPPLVHVPVGWTAKPQAAAETTTVVAVGESVPAEANDFITSAAPAIMS